MCLIHILCVLNNLFILENPAKHEPISEFIEVDIIPFLAINPIDITLSLGETIFVFLINISESLEQIEPKKFPENSLSFARTFDRGVTQVMADCRTADQHVNFFCFFFYFRLVFYICLNYWMLIVLMTILQLVG